LTLAIIPVKSQKQISREDGGLPLINAAIVGLGRWGQSFVRSVQGKSTDIRFVAGYTRTPAKARAFCQEHGVPLADSYEDILRNPNVDAVILATPHSQHEEQVKAAAAAGKHILVEKPIALTRKSAEATVEAARKAGVVFGVGFNRRFHPSIVELRQRLRDGRLGTLVAMVGQHTAGWAPFMTKDEWRLNPDESPAGALTGVGVHTIDHMIELGGPISEVYCTTSRRGIDYADDTTAIHLKFQSGMNALMLSAISTTPNYSLTVYGTKALVEVSHTTLEDFRFTPAPDAAPTGPVVAPPPEVIKHKGVDMLRTELEILARAIRERTPYPIAMEEILHGMSVFDAIVESVDTGKLVPVKGQSRALVISQCEI